MGRISWTAFGLIIIYAASVVSQGLLPESGRGDRNHDAQPRLPKPTSAEADGQGEQAGAHERPAAGPHEPHERPAAGPHEPHERPAAGAHERHASGDRAGADAWPAVDHEAADHEAAGHHDSSHSRRPSAEDYAAHGKGVLSLLSPRDLASLRGSKGSVEGKKGKEDWDHGHSFVDPEMMRLLQEGTKKERTAVYQAALKGRKQEEEQFKQLHLEGLSRKPFGQNKPREGKCLEQLEAYRRLDTRGQVAVRALEDNAGLDFCEMRSHPEVLSTLLWEYLQMPAELREQIPAIVGGDRPLTARVVRPRGVSAFMVVAMGIRIRFNAIEEALTEALCKSFEHSYPKGRTFAQLPGYRYFEATCGEPKEEDKEDKKRFGKTLLEVQAHKEILSVRNLANFGEDQWEQNLEKLDCAYIKPSFLDAIGDSILDLLDDKEWAASCSDAVLKKTTKRKFESDGDLLSLGESLNKLPKRLIKMISDDDLKNATLDFGITDPVLHKKIAIARTPIKDLADWDTADYEKAAKYIKSDKQRLQGLDKNKLKDNLEQFVKLEDYEEPKNLALVAQKMKDLQVFDSPSALTEEDFDKMKDVLPQMGRKWVKAMNRSLVKEKIDDIGKLKVKASEGYALLDAALGRGSDADSEGEDEGDNGKPPLCHLGNLLRYVKKSIIDDEPVSRLVTCVMNETLIDNSYDLPKRVYKRIMERVVAAENVSMRNLVPHLRRVFVGMPLPKVRNLTPADLGWEDDESNTLTMTRAQAGELLHKFLDWADRPNVNYGHLLGMAVIGLNEDTLSHHNFPAGFFEETIHLFYRFRKHLRKEQQALIADYFEVLTDNFTQVANLSLVDLVNYAPFLKEMKPFTEKFNRFPNEQKSVVMSEISAEDDLEDYSESDKAEFVDAALSVVVNEGDSTYVDQREASELSEGAVESLQKLKCFLGPRAGRMSADAVEDYLGEMASSCCLSIDHMQQLTRKFLSNRTGSQLSPTDLINMGPAAATVDPAVMATSVAPVLGQVPVEMGTAMKERKKRCERKNHSQRHHKEPETKAEDDLPSAFGKALIDAVLTPVAPESDDNPLTENGGPARRKRTAVSEPTLMCSDVRLLDSAVLLSVNASVIRTMHNSEFSDCLEIFGAEAEWSDEQLSVLFSKFNSIYNSTWTGRIVSLAANVLAGAPTEDLSRVEANVTSLDLEFLGSKTESIAPFTAEQLEVLFDRWDKVLSSGADIGNIRPLLCMFEAAADLAVAVEGLTEDHLIDALDLHLGQMACIASVATPLIDRLLTVASENSTYGAVEDWPGVWVETIGYLLAGLTPSQITLLVPEQVSRVNVDVINSLSQEQFLAFDASQMIFFSEDGDLTLSCSTTGGLNANQYQALVGRNQTFDESCLPAEDVLFPQPPVVEDSTDAVTSAVTESDTSSEGEGSESGTADERDDDTTEEQVGGAGGEGTTAQLPAVTAEPSTAGEAATSAGPSSVTTATTESGTAASATTTSSGNTAGASTQGETTAAPSTTEDDAAAYSKGAVSRVSRIFPGVAGTILCLLFFAF